MKKIGLVIILCAGFLKGMEKGYFPLGAAKATIITVLNTYDNPGDVIKAIKAMSLTNKDLNKIINEMYGNQKGFTALVHILADKFGVSSEDIVSMFKTPAAKEYERLRQLLTAAIYTINVDGVKQLLRQNVDVDAKFGKKTPLYDAVERESSIMVELLLDNGANPNVIIASVGLTKKAGTVLDFAQYRGASKEIKEIIQLLKKHGAKTLSELKK